MSFNSTILKNGLTVVSYNMSSVNSVAINIIVKVGSRYETASEAGISHFMEHMSFKSTKERTAAQIAKEFDAIGGLFNAYTSREHTVYYCKVLAENIDKAIDILADIMQNSVFDEQEIKKEKDVILQELAGVNDNPDDLAYENFYSLAYGKGDIGKSILGTKKSISKFTSKSFFDFKDKYYTANNIVISIAGNVEHNNICQKLEKLFCNLKQNPLYEPVKALYNGGFEYISKKLQQTTIALGFESVAYTNLTDYYHAQMASIILGGGLSSRLFQKIREELGLAYVIGTFNTAYMDSGIFSVYAGTDHKNIELTLNQIANELKLATEKINREELELAKAQIKSNIIMSDERCENKSEEIGKNFAIFGRHIQLDEVIENVMSTTETNIENILAKILASPPTLVLVGKNEKPINEEYLQSMLTL